MEEKAQQQQSSDTLHTFILYSTVASCVLLAIGILYAHFIGRRKNRLPDLPHSSSTARFWNELAHGEQPVSGGRRTIGTTGFVKVGGGEAEALLGRHEDQQQRQKRADDSDSVDSF